MKNERIPIQRAREISERHGWPEVLIIALDDLTGKVHGSSYGISRLHCSKVGNMLDEIMTHQGWTRDADQG